MAARRAAEKLLGGLSLPWRLPRRTNWPEDVSVRLGGEAIQRQPPSVRLLPERPYDSRRSPRLPQAYPGVLAGSITSPILRRIRRKVSRGQMKFTG